MEEVTVSGFTLVDHPLSEKDNAELLSSIDGTR